LISFRPISVNPQSLRVRKLCNRIVRLDRRPSLVLALLLCLVVSRLSVYHERIGATRQSAPPSPRTGRAPAGDVNVCIHGESGTGKELIARAIHYASPRRDRPLITLDCTTIPEGLMESHLF